MFKIPEAPGPSAKLRSKQWKEKGAKPIRRALTDEQKRKLKRIRLRRIDESEAEYKKDEDSVDSLKKVLAEFESKCSMNQTLYMWLVDYARSNIDQNTFKLILNVLKRYPGVCLDEKVNDGSKKNKMNIHFYYLIAATGAELKKMLHLYDDENQAAKVEDRKLDDDEMLEEIVRLFEFFGIIVDPGVDRNTKILREKLKEILASKGYGYREYYRLCLILKAFEINLELCSWDAKDVKEPRKKPSARRVDRVFRATFGRKPDMTLWEAVKQPNELGSVTLAESDDKTMKTDSKLEAYRKELEEKYEKHRSNTPSFKMWQRPQKEAAATTEENNNVSMPTKNDDFACVGLPIDLTVQQNKAVQEEPQNEWNEGTLKRKVNTVLDVMEAEEDHLAKKMRTIC